MAKDRDKPGRRRSDDQPWSGTGLRDLLTNYPRRLAGLDGDLDIPVYSRQGW